MPRPRTIDDDALLEVAREHFLRDGIGASTRAIAKAAGVSEGVLFQRFETKQGLFFRAMRLPTPALDAALAKARRDPDALAGLVGLGLSILAYLRDAMPSLLLVISHPAREAEIRPGTDRAEALIAPAFGLGATLRQYLEEREAEGRLAPRDLEATAALLMSALLTRAMHEALGLEPVRGARRWLRRTIDALGLAP